MTWLIAAFDRNLSSALPPMLTTLNNRGRGRTPCQVARKSPPTTVISFFRSLRVLAARCIARCYCIPMSTCTLWHLFSVAQVWRAGGGVLWRHNGSSQTVLPPPQEGQKFVPWASVARAAPTFKLPSCGLRNWMFSFGLSCLRHARVSVK